MDTFKLDAKSTNLMEHVQRNKPTDQVSSSLYCLQAPFFFRSQNWSPRT